MDEYLQLIRVVRDEMNENEIEELVIKNNAEMLRAMRGMQNSAYAAREAYYQYLQDKGAFAAESDQLEKMVKELEAELAKAKRKIKRLEK